MLGNLVIPAKAGIQLLVLADVRTAAALDPSVRRRVFELDRIVEKIIKQPSTGPTVPATKLLRSMARYNAENVYPNVRH